MNALKIWSTAVCMAALGCTVVRLLAPEKGSGKIFRLITASFFLCSLLFPLMELYDMPSLEIKHLPSSVVDAALETRVLEQLEEQVRHTVIRLVSDTLADRQIVAQKIEVETDISESGRISIEQVTVQMDKQHTAIASTMQGVLERTIGATVNIVIKE